MLDALRRIIRALRLSAGQTGRRTGMSTAQLFVLQQLADAPASSLNELAARTHTHQSSVSVVVSRLVARRLVAREPDPSDARRIMLAVTAAGRALLKRSPEPAQARMVGALERMPAGEVRSLARGLRELVRLMGADAEPPTMFFERERRATRLALRRAAAPGA